MRLEKIKLSGFKSFVDPTVLELRSSLVAVVGPNGCGKSNIIDAIRWVMGESSAKNLRGESMSDVIFNGSSTRKPVGQASIELVFNNADGSLGGEYAGYSEISVRRVGARDGQSSYFLNGTRCRRKDITDIFLGTGLGPRSYAIIEQGMISRVIEAKPEELRSFLEEAAGISLYRRRRHETEIRMRHTRENLDRLSDISQELEKQLERLKRQSESAERYQSYKEVHDRLEAELYALRWRVFNEQLQEHRLEIGRLSTRLEEKMAIRANIDLELEKRRDIHADKIDTWKEKQAYFYDVGTQMARVEQTIEHHRERQESLEADLAEAELLVLQTNAEIKQDQTRTVDLEDNWNRLQPDIELARNNLTQSAAVLLEAEEAMRIWNEGFETFQQQAEKPQRTAEVEKARIEQMERQSRDAINRLERLKSERANINVLVLEEQLSALDVELLSCDAKTQASVAEFNNLSDTLARERKNLNADQERLDTLRGHLQSDKGRLASLEALQQDALGKTDNSQNAWLEKNDLSHYARLGERLTVELGFENAVEMVLGDALEALCVPGIDPIAALLSELKEGDLIFVDTLNVNQKTHASLNILLDKIKTDLPLAGLLAGVYVVDTVAEALASRSLLNAGESIVTRDGIWIGANWLKVARGTTGHTGVLAREAELKEISARMSTVQTEIVAVQERVVEQQEKIKTLEEARDAWHKAGQQQSREVSEITAKISGLRARLESARNRLAQLESEGTEQKQKLDLAEEEIALARLTLQTALDEMEACSKKRVLLMTERDKLRELLQRANIETNQAKEKSHVLALQEQSLATQRKAVEDGLKRLRQQQQSSSERTLNLQRQLDELKAPATEMRDALEDLLSKRVLAEESLNQARSDLDGLEEELRSFEKERQFAEEEGQVLRSALEAARMNWQAIEVRTQTVVEKFVEIGQTLEEVLQTLPPEATEAVWAEELDQIVKKIQRLGAINLAAIEEYQTELERKQYLDAQQLDLTEALETLENAIRKIDKETRARFSETFEKVNTEFQKLFPRLFGGGQAYLELVGDDLLEAGVTVMARPPGKRNSSIHLLSGGEKALTAVSLVFAIFQLNPAPFCILDEVDAPLDDANVGRFCELVKELSKTVQLIFVTHNKLAMEMAHHLVGVTMKEPGVSRLVSVDVEEAAALVAD